MEDDERVLSETLEATLRYGLLLAALDDDAEARIGVWPQVVADMAEASTPLPRTVVPEERFDGSFLAEDMTALLVSCATQPLKLKSADGELYAKTACDLAEMLRPLPKWVEKSFEMSAEIRVRTAATYLRTFGLVERRMTSSGARLEISELGRQWMAVAAGDRIRVLIDGVMDRKQSVPAFRDFKGAQIGMVPATIYVQTRMKSPPDLSAAALEAMRQLPGDGFYVVEDFLAYCRSMNPLVVIFKADKHAGFALGYGYAGHGEVARLQKMWMEMMGAFVRSRLLPLGCVQLGVSKEGVSMSVTPCGRYYLGQTKEWAWAGRGESQVIVQPNFEVMFLGESPLAEAEIGRFAERVGRQTGAVFQITKKSIYAAASSGITVESVLAGLDKVCSRPVPGNVKREIEGWFAQCREVSFESVTVIRCPDRETAVRITAMAKGAAKALSDTVLEYKDPGRQRSWMIRKLKGMGVTVTEQDKAAEQVRDPYRRRRRRWY